MESSSPTQVAPTNNALITTQKPPTPEDTKRFEESHSKTLPISAKNPVLTISSLTQDASVRSTEEKPLKRSRLLSNYIEYDLSKMKDTRGGFLIDENDSEEFDSQKKPKLEQHKVDYDPPISLDPALMPRCRECRSMDIDIQFDNVFHVRVCYKCKEAIPEKYSLITKTEAREDYLLTDPELKDSELLPHWLKPNPRKSTWNNMMLYLREQVESYAFQKWGGPEGLDAEYDRRETEKKKRKDKKFKEKLADLRKRTITSTWDQRSKKHEHEFGDAVLDPETGNSVQTCLECGIISVSEEI